MSCLHFLLQQLNIVLLFVVVVLLHPYFSLVRLAHRLMYLLNEQHAAPTSDIEVRAFSKIYPYKVHISELNTLASLVKDMLTCIEVKTFNYT